jgi:hypothetical protein
MTKVSWMFELHRAAPIRARGRSLHPADLRVICWHVKKNGDQDGLVDFCVFFINQEKHTKNTKKTGRTPIGGLGLVKLLVSLDSN